MIDFDLRRLAPGLPLVLATALAACDPAPTAPSHPGTDAPPTLASVPETAGAEVGSWLANLRESLAPYHRLEAALAANWDTDITGCLEDPVAGGMGHHYADLVRLDDVIEETRPEALLYEPQRNGRMRLVAVEYVVPFSETWPEEGPAPMLQGQPFSANEVFGVWALHAWIWHHNPSGMFASWNPRVSCAHAD